MFSAPFLQAQTKKAIRIATDGYYPPYNSLNEDTGELEGYEIDLAREICALAEIECVFELQKFSTIIPSIRFNKHDVIMAGLNDNNLRRKVIDFTLPYAIGYFTFLTRTNSPLSNFCSDCDEIITFSKTDLSKPELTKAILTSLAGKSIGVEKNSIPHRFFSENKALNGKVNLVFGKNIDEIYDHVVSGKLDVALANTSFWEDKFKKVGRDKAQYIGPKMTGGVFGYGVAIATRKSDQDLKAKLSQAIVTLKKNGKMKALSEKWFGYDITPKN